MLEAKCGMTLTSQSEPSFGQFIGHVARSFFQKLGEFANHIDNLPIEDKQSIKHGLVQLLSKVTVGGKKLEAIKTAYAGRRKR
jgi:hypothetical protein